ncbi:hypothetical protein NQ318_020114 [Aromia moschata]|uniref:Protein hunchback n=1 Tax=Aromia moschata TaxID=1265417 RepID=A0AAV8ZAL4_9CUCU|nr:hypothetical protein NQ318_020114 [Aromia moschata]
MKYPGDDAITALRHLQMTMIHQGVFDSPKSSDGSDENKSDNETEEYNEHGVKVPKINAHGKVKNFKCKQCDFVAHSKLEFWQHTRTHIKAEKRLTCPRCPFVTEYKHHLEYHLRNHVGSKPFKCTQCNYSCVNKSMLNSHLKSHSNVYQYRCANCSYASKYCHSLKLHLRKYNHHPDMVLNPDGTPNPFPIIDVYGTRRGPKVKTQESRPPTEQKPEYVLPFPFNRMTLNVPPHLQLPFAGFPFFGGFPTTMLMRGLEQLSIEEQGASTSESARGKPAETMETESSVLDLSKPGGSGLGRGEARAFQVPATNDEDSSDEETTMFSNVEVVENKAEERKDEAGAASNASSNSTPNANDNNNNSEGEYKCTYCSINFGDAVLYTMHMGYHGYRFPFTCNRCGEECHDKVSFFLHIARTPHS